MLEREEKIIFCTAQLENGFGGGIKRKNRKTGEKRGGGGRGHLGSLEKKKQIWERRAK